MTLGEKIQSLRKQHGLSQEQLADTLNVSRQAVSKWETDESQPDIDRLVEISGMFNVSTDYLIKNNPTTTTVSLAKASRSASSFRTKRIAYLVSAIYSAAFVVFLILGFVWSLWHPGWIILFLPPVIVRFLAQHMSKDEEDYKAFEEAMAREDDEL